MLVEKNWDDVVCDDAVCDDVCVILKIIDYVMCTCINEESFEKKLTTHAEIIQIHHHA